MTICILQALLQAKQQLLAAQHAQQDPYRLSDVGLEAEILLAHVMVESRAKLHAWPEKELTAVQYAQFQEYINRRCQQEPIAYLIGRRSFWSLDFEVTPDTLIPRPETEGIVELVLAEFSACSAAKIADLGTGCGAIGLALAHERPAWQLYLSDISEKALEVARRNAQRFSLKNTYFACKNWSEALLNHHFDAVVSNPPYIASEEWAQYAPQLLFEPQTALVSGPDGLHAIREISTSVKPHIKVGGLIALEHGFNQAAAVRAILDVAGYQQIKSICDLAGHERITVGWVG